MNLSDIVARYTIPKDTIEVVLGGQTDAVMRFRTITSAPEYSEVAELAKEFSGDMVIIAGDLGDPEAVEAARALAGTEFVFQACLLARALIEEGSTEQERRFAFMKMAHRAGPWFHTVWREFSQGLLSDSLTQVGDAVAGKAGCGQTPLCASDCEQPETCGASTPTN